MLNLKASTKFAATYDVAKSITAITKANPANLTSAAHTMQNGDIVVLSVNGMADIDGQVARVANVTANAFDLEGVDTTISDTFVSGNFVRILTWNNLANISKIDIGDSSASRVDVTRMASEVKEYEYAIPDAPEIKLTNMMQVNEAAANAFKMLGRQGKTTVLFLSYKSGQKLYVNIKVAPGGGTSMGSGEAVTQSFAGTQIGQLMWY